MLLQVHDEFIFVVDWDHVDDRVAKAREGTEGASRPVWTIPSRS